MATVAERVPAVAVLPRPQAHHGFWSWVTTVDHKRIGVLYAVTAFAFFILGGIEAILIRLQLAVPGNTLIHPETFNQLFTMHGTTMIFLVVMPLSVAFFNIAVPLQIGARDVAFPRLNALSYWIFLSGGIFLNLGWLHAAAPNAGWFSYANLTERAYNPGPGVDYWALGLLVLGTASMAGAFNFIVTIINLRAPGMSLMRMPVFTWMTFVTSFLIIFAFPIITVALLQLVFDRNFGTAFFRPSANGDVVLWQHLFWLFGHPEVYILILPAMGVVSEVLPVFSRKPLFGYAVIVYSGIAIAFVSYGVWAHHMFTVGLGPVANAVFLTTTMAVGVPTGVKIFNWIATMWRGSLDLRTPMLMAIGFISMFTIGGLSGITHAVAPHDWQQQDTYYIVAHFHYVLFGGAIMGLFAGIYYWWPKVTGRMLHDGLGQFHFWLMLIGFNLTFGPMHILGLNGMPRRIFTYPAGMGWDFWNMVATAGAFMIGISVLVFMYNAAISLRRGARAGADPWDGRTLEWMIPSPPPEYNFREIPTVHGRDELWLRKHPYPHGAAEREEARELRSDRLEVHLGGREVGTGEIGATLPGMAGEGEVAQVDRAAGVGPRDRHGSGILLRLFGGALGILGLVLAATVHAGAGLALFAIGFLIFAVFGVYAVGATGGGPVEPPIATHWTPEGSPDADDDAHHGIHLPDPSYYPLITALGLTLMAAGFIYGYWLTGIGAIMLLFGVYAWCFEPING
jgi:cytochrome c oxidase subunit 1